MIATMSDYVAGQVKEVLCFCIVPLFYILFFTSSVLFSEYQKIFGTFLDIVLAQCYNGDCCNNTYEVLYLWKAIC